MSHWNDWASEQLDALHALHRFRENIAFDGDGPQGMVRGRQMTAYAANDYLGLSSHPQVRAAAIAAIERFGTGATASRLVVGTRSLHDELEAELADWKHSQRALVFSSGYAANIGVLTSLGTADVTVFSDSLNHASIIDGCRLSKARSVIYPHLDMDSLARQLAATPGRKLVVSETVFSMDGDVVPLREISELCRDHDALLVLDEAHAAVGPDHVDVPGLDVLHVGTLSKTLGALGGFVAGSKSLVDLLVNRARTFIFTTGLSPADTAAALAALRICRSAEGDALRTRLRALIDILRPGHPSAVIPVILGDDEHAVRGAAILRERGLYVPAIRPPTVAPGTSRLRVALSAAHTPEMVMELRDALAELTALPDAISA